MIDNVRGLRVRLGGYLAAMCLLGVALLLASCGGQGSVAPGDLNVPANTVGRVVYFTAADCDHCDQIYQDVIEPLKERCGPSLEVKVVDIGTQQGYEAMLATEQALIGDTGRFEVPAVVVEQTYLIGETAIRQQLVSHLECVFGAGGNAWPDVPALDKIATVTPVPTVAANTPFAGSGGGAASCLTDEASAVCASPEPIFALYFTDASCTDTCDRTRYDLRYLQGVYPQLAFDERNIADNEALAQAIGEQLGIPQDQRLDTPAVIVGKDYLIGGDVTLDALREMIGKYTDSGATAFWYTLDVQK